MLKTLGAILLLWGLPLYTEKGAIPELACPGPGYMSSSSTKLGPKRSVLTSQNLMYHVVPRGYSFKPIFICRISCRIYMHVIPITTFWKRFCPKVDAGIPVMSPLFNLLGQLSGMFCVVGLFSLFC